MTIKSMRAKYPGHCSRSGARINPGDDIKFDTITRRAWLEEPGDSRVVFYGDNGPTVFHRNPRGRCEDAPYGGENTLTGFYENLSEAPTTYYTGDDTYENEG